MVDDGPRYSFRDTSKVFAAKVGSTATGSRQRSGLKATESEVGGYVGEMMAENIFATKTSEAPASPVPLSPGAATTTTAPTRQSLSFSFTTDDEEFVDDDEDGFVLHGTPSSVGLDISSSILAPYFETNSTTTSFTPIKQRATTYSGSDIRTHLAATDRSTTFLNTFAGGSLSPEPNPSFISASPSTCSTNELLDRAVDLARRAGVEENLLAGPPNEPAHLKADDCPSPREDEEDTLHATSAPSGAREVRKDSISCVSDTIADMMTSLCSPSAQQQPVELSSQEEDMPQVAELNPPDASQQSKWGFPRKNTAADHDDTIETTSGNTSLWGGAASSARTAIALSLSPSTFADGPVTFLDSICGPRDNNIAPSRSSTATKGPRL